MIASWKLRVEGTRSELILLDGDLAALRDCLSSVGVALPRRGSKIDLTGAQAYSLLLAIEELDMLAVGGMPIRQRVEGAPELGFVSPRKLIELVKDLLASSISHQAA